jgi:hypothetical protein
VRDRLAPGQPVTGVVHLVEHHQGALGAGACLVDGWARGDLRVRRDVALQVGADRPDAVRQRGVQADAEGERRLGPLGAQVVGGADDHHSIHDPRGEQLGGQRQREGGLAGARCRGDEEVLAAPCAVGLQRLALPGAQRPARGRSGQGGGGHEGVESREGQRVADGAVTKSISISTERRTGTSRSA